MINIDKAFNSENRTVYDYFQRPGVGYYIPHYQREYSWDNDNIEQLLEDLTKGVENLCEEEKTEIRFLGTIITVTETDKPAIQPQDTKALPSSIEKLIDGQQRISTICLLSTLLYSHLQKTEDQLQKAIKKGGFEKETSEFLINEIEQISKYWKVRLANTFSIDLQRGVPERKPKIIRGSQDKWVMKEETNTSYLSPIAKYLYRYIDFFFNSGEVVKPDTSTNVGKNLRQIDNWVKEDVLKAHLRNDSFPVAKVILEKLDAEYLWQYHREELLKYIDDSDCEKPGSYTYNIYSFVQLLSCCHYLLERCCFTVIQPVNDDWAFDMFQSLNATGTPLTAIETFKPLVVNSIDDFKNSKEHKSFEKIENTFADLSSAALKSRRTDELITSFALVCNGKRQSSHFSSQRKWLNRSFEEFNKKGVDFVDFFGNYSEFYKRYWIDYSLKENRVLDFVEKEKEAELASILLVFLKDSNHKMVLTVLGLLYHRIVKKEILPNDFIEIIKVFSAFYILWRSTRSNSGLDDVYRAYFMGSKKNGTEACNYYTVPNFDVQNIKRYIQKEIANNLQITSFDDWASRVEVYLKYNNSATVCKYLMIISAHDTIPDPSRPGLHKSGVANCFPTLKIDVFNDDSFKSIEHIAPRTSSPNQWSPNLYDERELFDRIGNLALLPQSLNSSMSNKGLKEKLIYYKHMSERDPSVQQELKSIASKNGIILNESNIKILEATRYKGHIEPLKSLDLDFKWDEEFVKIRGKNILETAWSHLSKWIK